MRDFYSSVNDQDQNEINLEFQKWFYFILYCIDERFHCLGLL